MFLYDYLAAANSVISSQEFKVGYTMFLYDYLAAANSVISSQEFKVGPIYFDVM